MKKIKKILPMLIITIALSTQLVLATPNNAFHVSNLRAVSGKTDILQVSGYFYNVGTESFSNIKNVKIVIKDASGKTVSCTFNDNGLKNIIVDPSTQVNWTFFVKVKNLKNYNFSKATNHVSYDFSY